MSETRNIVATVSPFNILGTVTLADGQSEATWTRVLSQYADTANQSIPAALIVSAHESSHISGGTDAFLSTDVLEAVVKRLRETGGATLAMGAITDGQFFKRSGTDIISATPASVAATFNPNLHISIADNAIPANSNLICADFYEIGSGFMLDISGAALMYLAI